MINNRQNGRRGRGRNGVRPQGGAGRPEQGNRIDNRARGNANQLHEKYKTLARDAQMQGDRVLTEYYLQFADHYFRVLGESRARFDEQRRPRDEYQARSDQDDFEDEADGEANAPADGLDEQQPRFEQGRDRQDRGQRQRSDRQDRQERRPDRRDRADLPDQAERPSPAQWSGDEQRDVGENRARDEAPRPRAPRPAAPADAAPVAAEAAPSDEPTPVRAVRPRTRRAAPVETNGAGERIDVLALPPALSPVSEPAGDADADADEAPRRRRTRRLRAEASDAELSGDVAA